MLFNSNSESALQCAKETVDACITTLKAAKNNNGLDFSEKSRIPDPLADD